MAVLATDDFGRANNADLGANWTVYGSNDNFKIAANAAAPNNLAGADAAETYSAITWPDDQYGEVTLTALTGGSSGTGLGLMLRATSTDTYYRVVVGAAGANNVVVTTRPANVDIALRTQTFSAGDVLRAEVQGTTIRLYRNGVQIGADITDGTITTGQLGIFFSSTMTAGLIDAFAGGDFTATAEHQSLYSFRRRTVTR